MISDRARTARDLVVLVVEDSPDLGAILAAALEDEGCTVHLARSGDTAVGVARRLGPDLITLDLGLPDLSGAEVVRALRSDAATQGVPIVAVTAHSYEIEPALRAQLADVIAKPFYISEVVAAVLDTLGIPPDGEPGATDGNGGP